MIGLESRHLAKGHGHLLAEGSHQPAKAQLLLVDLLLGLRGLVEGSLPSHGFTKLVSHKRLLGHQPCTELPEIFCHPLPGSEVPVEDLNRVVKDRRFLRVVSRDSYL